MEVAMPTITSVYLCFGLFIGMSSSQPESAPMVQAPRWTMNNGLEMPAVALGTYLGFDQNGVLTSKNKELRDVVRRAIDIGYRHIDTAAVYNTEGEVGEGIADRIANGTVSRGDMFVTTKLWNTRHGRKQVEDGLRESLGKLKMEYVDLYLIHWPLALNDDYSFSNIDYMETWRGMEDVHKLGLAKSIGVSNFNKTQLARVLKDATIKPAALQIEAHPQIVQEDLVTYAQAQGLIVMGFSPFGSLVPRFGLEAGGPTKDDPTLVEIATKYGKTTPQIFLRWLIDRKIVPIPKTIRPDRLLENINIFDFQLTPEEIARISRFDAGKRFTLPSFWQKHPNYPFEQVGNPVPNPFGK